MPGWIATLAGAKAVWDEEIRRVVACGAVECDTSMFARCCVEEARYRSARLAGDDIAISALTELRRMAELLGVGGPRSRLGRASAPAEKPTSGFGRAKPA